MCQNSEGEYGNIPLRKQLICSFQCTLFHLRNARGKMRLCNEMEETTTHCKVVGVQRGQLSPSGKLNAFFLT